VLRRVALGKSNKAVAREMGVSVSTVKTHLRAVFERLGARSRTQAVARAREEGIL
jgi:DNA-binding NarL/FixJ family response regulator